MSKKYECPNCGYYMDFEGSKQGKQATCPICHHNVNLVDKNERKESISEPVSDSGQVIL